MINQIRFPYEVEYVSAFFCVFNINIIIPESMPALALQKAVKCLHWLYREWSTAYIGFTESGSMPTLARALERVVQSFHWLNKLSSIACMHGLIESGLISALVLELINACNEAGDCR